MLTALCVLSLYDMGYLLKALTAAPMPSEEGEFFELLHIFFPNIYDIKFMMKSCKNLKGGLQDVAEHLAVRRRALHPYLY